MRRECLDWQQLLNEALTAEGSVTDIYSRFYEYSIGNCILLRMQGANEPVNTLKRWNAMNRRVIAGSKAYSIMVPMISRHRDDDGEEQRLLGGSNYPVACSPSRRRRARSFRRLPCPVNGARSGALGNLAIREVPFELLEANTRA